MKRVLSVLLAIAILLSSTFIVFATQNTVQTIVATDSCEVVYNNPNNRNTIYVNNNPSAPIYLYCDG